MPETCFARSGEVSIAYQVIGEGPIDVVYVPGFVSNVAMLWRVPELAKYVGRLASFSRLIIFDKRGTGMSDRDVGAPNLETRMDDVRAVMDAAGSSRAAIVGVSEGGPMSILFAATYPDRVSGMVLLSSNARPVWAPDYSFGESIDQYDRWTRRAVDGWGSEQFFDELIRVMAPGYDSENRRAMGEYLRQSSSPGAVGALDRLNRDIDVRAVLPTVRTPTLVLSLAQDDPSVVEASRYMAQRIPGARHLTIDGRGHVPTSENMASLVGEIEKFLLATASQPAVDPGRVLATLLFTDIVDSTIHAAELGDRDWRDLLQRHHALVRDQLDRFRGQELDTAGDGFFARFDGPARAIHCARALVDGLQDIGIQIRAGLHTGECELFENKVGGIAVSIGARVAAAARPGEILVSRTVKDLVAGSGITFQERGKHNLKNVPGEWELYAVSPE